MADSSLSLKGLLEEIKKKKGYTTNVVDDKWKSLRELKSLLDDQLEFRSKPSSFCEEHDPNQQLRAFDLKNIENFVKNVVPCSCNSVSNKACSCQNRTAVNTCSCYNYTCSCVSRGPGISCDCVYRTAEPGCTCFDQTCGCQGRTSEPACSCNIQCSGHSGYAVGPCPCNGANPSNCDYVGTDCYCNLNTEGGCQCHCVGWYTNTFGMKTYQLATASFMDTSCSCAFRNPIERGCSCHVASGSLGCGCHQRTSVPYTCSCNYACTCRTRTASETCSCVSRGSITCTCNTECTCQGRTSAPSCPCNVVCNCDIQDTFNN